MAVMLQMRPDFSRMKKLNISFRVVEAASRRSNSNRFNSVLLAGGNPSMRENESSFLSGEKLFL